MQLFAKFKKILRRGFRSTLNFQFSVSSHLNIQLFHFSYLAITCLEGSPVLSFTFHQSTIIWRLLSLETLAQDSHPRLSWEVLTYFWAVHKTTSTLLFSNITESLPSIEGSGEEAFPRLLDLIASWVASNCSRELNCGSVTQTVLYCCIVFTI